MFLGTCGVLFWKTEHGPRRWDVQVKNAEMDCSDHRQSKTESYKGNDASNGFLSSPCNSSLSNEGSSKSKKESSRTCEAIKNRNLVADENAKAHHQRSVSLGNVCKSPQNFKDGQAIEARPKNHVLGLGRCHYGHGNITRRVNVAAGNKSMPKSPNFLSSQSSSAYHKSLEGLNNMGNMECRRASFLDAISFYDKVIALCAQNAACHNDKGRTSA
ncbi:unnamed protein product [Prunus armeniaca]|uniref:Uncharacterized protein n=1 Tax=Prunus armeniaca TaxID=36596 RepID=A0A6J5X2G1_PRUAR|nr:unnamed protein product [Prunus armeniaca]CAB4305324.1 unnamed protein product [Prunus armeniaca]